MTKSTQIASTIEPSKANGKLSPDDIDVKNQENGNGIVMVNGGLLNHEVEETTGGDEVKVDAEAEPKADQQPGKQMKLLLRLITQGTILCLTKRIQYSVKWSFCGRHDRFRVDVGASTALVTTSLEQQALP